MMKHSTSGVLLTVVVAMPTVLHAQQESGTLQLDALTVTARKLAENPHQVPISLTVEDRQALQERRIDSLEDALRRVPNVGFSSLGDGRSTFLSIRGIGPMSQPLGHDDASTVLYVDGVPQPLFASDAALLDIERVEVLRGPQGTVFGRNAQGGAVSLTTRQPGDVFEGEVRLEAGLDPRSRDRTQLSLSGPLVEERLAGLLAIGYSNLGADVDNSAGGDLGHHEDRAFRGSLVFTPGDATRLVLAAHGQHDQGAPSNFVLKDASGYPRVALQPKGWIERDIHGLSLTASHDFESVTLTSVTAYNRYSFDNLTNNSEALTFSRVFGLPESAFLPATDWSTYDEQQSNLYQELRLSSREDALLGWVTGVTYEHDDYRMRSVYQSPFFAATNGSRDNHYKTDSRAVFGEINVPVPAVEGLKATFGLRYTRDEKRYDSLYRSNGFPGNVTSYRQQGDLNFDLVTGRFALDYALNDAATLYASIARGAKSGGFPNFTNNAPSGLDDQPYGESKSWTYEIGLKHEFQDGRGRLNLALFRNDVEDENLNALDSTSFVFMPKPINTRSHGVELDLAYRLDAAWDAGLGLGYTHAEVRNVSADVAASSGAEDGNRVPSVPEVNGNLYLQYRDSAAWLGLPGADLFGMAQYQYVGKRAADVGNHFDLNAYGILNARLGLEFERVDLYLFGENLADERPEYIGLNYGPNAQAVTVGHGRVLGVGTEVRF